MNQDNSQTRRRYSTEFKRQVMAECAKPGASVASVALSHGINANVVHKWRAKHVAGFEYPNKRPEFIAVPMGMAVASIMHKIKKSCPSPGLNARIVSSKQAPLTSCAVAVGNEMQGVKTFYA
jgi:transposase